MLRCALLQYACGESSRQPRAEALIRQAAAGGAQLLLLPELHQGRYFCHHQQVAEFERAEALDGPTSQWLAALAAELQVVIVGSIFERRATGLYHNTAIVLDSDGNQAGFYRKMHIPQDPGYEEKFYFTPGDGDCQPIATSVGRLGVLVCWDQWYPEAARLQALAGADLLLYPTAIGWDSQDDNAEQQRQLDAWQTVQRGHAVANGMPVLSCNRVGQEGDTRFWGGSFICGPQGEWLARADDQAQLLLADIDMKRSEQTRRIWPFLRDRRIDKYQDLSLRLRD